MRRWEGIEWDADEYDHWYEEEPGRTIDLIETECVLSLLLPVRGRKILDVGCGTGNFTRKLKALGYDVIGLEPNTEMRSKAIEKGLECVEGIAEEIPFEDETFDAVVSVAAVEFFDDLSGAISEMIRVVKRGGKVVIGFITGPWAEFYEEKGRKGHPIFSKARFPRIEEIAKYASKVEFCLRTPPGRSVNFENELTFEDPGFACALIERV